MVVARGNEVCIPQFAAHSDAGTFEEPEMASCTRAHTDANHQVMLAKENSNIEAKIFLALNDVFIGISRGRKEIFTRRLLSPGPITDYGRP